MPTDYRSYQPQDLNILKAGSEIVSALLEDYNGPNSPNPNELMKKAIKQGNKNISLTTMGIKRKPRLSTRESERPEKCSKINSPITGNPHSFN